MMAYGVLIKHSPKSRQVGGELHHHSEFGQNQRQQSGDLCTPIDMCCLRACIPTPQLQAVCVGTATKPSKQSPVVCGFRRQRPCISIVINSACCSQMPSQLASLPMAEAPACF
jgi:hypothetical protein